jgi:hypothetical protein
MADALVQHVLARMPDIHARLQQVSQDDWEDNFEPAPAAESTPAAPPRVRRVSFVPAPKTGEAHAPAPGDAAAGGPAPAPSGAPAPRIKIKLNLRASGSSSGATPTPSGGDPNAPALHVGPTPEERTPTTPPPGYLDVAHMQPPAGDLGTQDLLGGGLWLFDEDGEPRTPEPANAAEHSSSSVDV